MSFQVWLILEELVAVLTLQSLSKEMDRFDMGVEVSFLRELELTKSALEGLLAQVKSLMLKKLTQWWYQHTALMILVHLVEALESFEES